MREVLARLARVRDVVEGARAGIRRAALWVGGDPALAAGALLSAAFVLSLLLYLGTGTERVRRVLFFPDAESGKLAGEEHFVPRTRGTEESVRMLVKELLLGPASYELGRLLPRSVKLRSVSLRERVLYVDFSTDLVLDAAAAPLGLAEIVQGVANNAYFNFPRLRGVYIFVHGQIPDLPGVGGAGLAYRNDLVR
jgi:hypothetical protein